MNVSIELPGCTLHVLVSETGDGPGIRSETDYFLQSVDLTNPEEFADAYGAIVLTSADAFEWWNDMDRADRLKQECDWWVEEHCEPWDVY